MLFFQYSRESEAQATQRVYTHWYSKGSLEGLVSMAGVAVVRGALDRSQWGSRNSRRFKTTQRTVQAGEDL